MEFTIPRPKLNASETIMLPEVEEFILIIDFYVNIEKGKRGCYNDCVLGIRLYWIYSIAACYSVAIFYHQYILNHPQLLTRYQESYIRSYYMMVIFIKTSWCQLASITWRSLQHQNCILSLSLSLLPIGFWCIVKFVCSCVWLCVLFFIWKKWHKAENYCCVLYFELRTENKVINKHGFAICKVDIVPHLVLVSCKLPDGLIVVDLWCR